MKESELKIEEYGIAGIMITHLRAGMVVCCGGLKTREENLEKAMKMIEENLKFWDREVAG